MQRTVSALLLVVLAACVSSTLGAIQRFQIVSVANPTKCYGFFSHTVENRTSTVRPPPVATYPPQPPPPPTTFRWATSFRLRGAANCTNEAATMFLYNTETRQIFRRLANGRAAFWAVDMSDSDATTWPINLLRNQPPLVNDFVIDGRGVIRVARNTACITELPVRGKPLGVDRCPFQMPYKVVMKGTE
jgi:hypothetical protein